jgi:hypothetical protein
MLFILAIALICGFLTYLLWYVHIEYRRLGREFNLPEVLGWDLGESPAFFLYLDVMPATIVAGVCYPIGYLASFQFFRLIRSYSEPERSTKATGSKVE